MLVICETNPNKEYQIEKIRDVYFCYPKTEAEYLELLLVYNGNNIQGNLDLLYTEANELPDNLTVKGWMDISYSKIKNLPNNLTIGGSLFLKNNDIPNNVSIPKSVKVNGKVIR